VFIRVYLWLFLFSSFSAVNGYLLPSKCLLAGEAWETPYSIIGQLCEIVEGFFL